MHIDKSVFAAERNTNAKGEHSTQPLGNLLNTNVWCPHRFLSNSFIYLTHTVALYTFIVLLSYLMLVIYVSVPVCSLSGKGQNID